MSDSTPDSRACPKCSSPLPAEAAEGLCPRCLMAEAMQPTGPKKTWEPPTAAELGELLPEYDIEKLLGRGGMGAVYKGTQKSLDRPVAIKILSATLDESDQGFAERFKNEARALGKLKHPGIVGVYDFGTAADGLLYIVMEYIDGTDVAKMIAQKGRLHTDHAMAITAHVCDALAYAHERGIIHRDIKPANIMVGYDGVVQVADFGLAKVSIDGQTLGLTQSGMAMGTMHYMAPEALMLGTAVDHRADIYAVGVMLYQMLTGKLPQGLFSMPSLQIKGLDPRYDGIIGKALMEDRDARYQTVNEMRMGLDEILTQPVVKAEAGGGKTPAALNTQARPKRPGGAQNPPPESHEFARAGNRTSPWLWAVLIAILALGSWEFLRKRPAAATPQPNDSRQADAAKDPPPDEAQPIVPTERPLPDLFLGDLKPDILDLSWPYGVSQYFKGEEHDSKVLQIDGKDCERYLLTHTPSHLEFAIPQGYTRFKATGFAPFDTLTNKHLPGDWIYRVQVDDEVVFESQELRTYPNYQVPIDVPLAAGAKKLVLKTISHGGDQNGHSLWGYPTLVSDRSPSMANSPSASGTTPAATNTKAPHAVDLLALIDPERDSDAGVWKRTPEGLLIESGEGPCLVFAAYQPPDEYDYILEFTLRADSIGNVGQTCTKNGQNVLWVLQSYSGDTAWSGFKIDDRPLEHTDAKIAQPALVKGVKYKSVVQVRRDVIRAFLNDKLLVEWKGEFKTGSPPNPSKPVGFSTWHSGVVFHKAEIIPYLPTPATTPNITATKDAPFVNSLGMKFVSVPGTKVLFCIHETRRQDYAAYAGEVPGVDGSWKNQMKQGILCGHEDKHPVVGVSWEDAVKFCEWLSKKDGRTYRLPSDEEWSTAVGLGSLEKHGKDTTPEMFNGKETTVLPWEGRLPPETKDQAGNYADETWHGKFPAAPWIENYSDGYVTTAPVMSFKANKFGLYDLGGNVWEYCGDWYNAAQKQRVLRGASFYDNKHGFLIASSRAHPTPNSRIDRNGFRVVLELGVDTAPSPAPASAPDTLGDPPNTTKRVIDLIPLVDVKRDASNGAWSKTPEGISLAKVPDSGPRIQFPHPIATDEYDYEVEISYANADMEHRLGFPVFGRRIDWAMNIFSGSETPTYFFVDLDGRPATQAQEAVVRLPQLKQGSRHHTLIKVRNGELAAFFDGKQVVRWKGDTKRFNPSPRNVRDPQFPDLFFYWGGIQLHQAKITEFVPKTTSPLATAPAPSKITPATITDKTLAPLLARATKDQPFVNSLGMKFVPVAGTKTLFCVHETRRQDYAAFAAANPATNNEWMNQRTLHDTAAGGESVHPVVGVSWHEAAAFCAWLSKQEGHLYRLPTDREWSQAVGIATRESDAPNSTPEMLSEKLADVYPWGSQWPPPTRAGNYADLAWRRSFSTDLPLDGYEDGFPTTAPVMSFQPNGLGLYDLGGNVWEWCQDWWNGAQNERVLRGSCWNDLTVHPNLWLSSFRFHRAPDTRDSSVGFRCVIEIEGTTARNDADTKPPASQLASGAALLEQQYQAAIAKQVTPAVNAYAKTLSASYRSALTRAAKNFATSKSDVAVLEQEIQRLDTQDNVPDDEGANATITKLRTIYRDALEKFRDEKTAPLKAVYEKQQAAAQKPTSVSSSFKEGAESWTVFESNGSTNLVKDDSKGYLPYMDYGPGSDYFFAAPPPFVDAAHRASSNATLSFDLRISASDNATYDAVILESPTLTLVLPKPNPPVNRWTTFSYRFHPSEGWMVGTLGRDSNVTRAATAAEIEKALHTATRLLIRGEWSSSSGDTAWLDNVRLDP